MTPRLNWSWGEYNCYYTYGGFCPPDSVVRLGAIQHAESHVGDPYNFNVMNYRDVTSFYCTSLMWHSYNVQTPRFNILYPYSMGNFGIILPSMVRDSTNIATFKVSKI